MRRVEVSKFGPTVEYLADPLIRECLGPWGGQCSVLNSPGSISRRNVVGHEAAEWRNGERATKDGELAQVVAADFPPHPHVGLDKGKASNLRQSHPGSKVAAIRLIQPLNILTKVLPTSLRVVCCFMEGDITLHKEFNLADGSVDASTYSQTPHSIHTADIRIDDE
ncbi:predicted protein [Histoplasma capsulatum G186AR]|uniref:Uncharacterized protein n=1 Tax=Ajellomyces capsulatus (strain G186AR / H82 / ATCC MYA-2454 / RMSCC 2432) TaxID=447093 RepID=C0NDC2_AJECG|nr:uncharacterized protein HCBG_01118 [Histoplasma capsulatum G186AR]EEH11663.1 predicted protein [Histoplasma capsulatum G186AR]